MNEASDKVLETERLVLLKLSTDDAEFILRLVNEPSWLQFIGDRGVRSIEDARQYILKGPLDSYERRGFGLFAVKMKESEIPIGICGLLKRDSLDDVDIGFAFLPDFWGKGYAYESAAAVMAFATTLGLKKIVAIVSKDNQPSIRVLEKIGMRFERVITLPGEDAEVFLYASQELTQGATSSVFLR